MSRKKPLTLKQAEKELRERGLALAYGPHQSASGERRWFVATEVGRVVAEGRGWQEAFENAMRGQA